MIINTKNNILMQTNAIKNEIAMTILKNRMPIHTTVTITNNCNFHCRHCYMSTLKDKNKNITKEDWNAILSILKLKGCISLTITGGEPLYSDYFLHIYEYAYSLNFKITIMTNLSLINNYILNIFKQKPPFQIIGTLYGVSNTTYKDFCFYKNGWNTIKENIENLLSMGINLKLQTILNKYNIVELEKIVDYVNAKKINFHAYRRMTCDITGNAYPKKYQITQQQIKYSYLILKDEKKRLANIEQNKELWKEGYKNCCAGISACYINSSGEMYLCNHYIENTFNINRLGFDECWNRISKLRKRIIECINECGRCKNNIYCGKCNPLFIHEKKKQGFPFEECNKFYRGGDYDMSLL